MRSKLIDKSTAELLGKIALQEKVIAEMVSRIEEQDLRIVEMERRLSRVVSRSQLVTEAQAAEMLDVSVQTLARWRKSARQPIPVIQAEGIIRYRVEAIEHYLQSRERGRSHLRAA